jgi:hypothetical protein
MTDKTPTRQMFPDSRLVLGLLCPILAFFFGVCVYVTHEWQPASAVDKIGKFVVEDVLFTFITLCIVGLIASVVGPRRIQAIVSRITGKAARAALALALGTIVYMIYCSLP